MMASEASSATALSSPTLLSLPLAELVLDGPVGRFRLDHRYVRVEAEQIARDGGTGLIHVEKVDGRFVVISGAHTVLALRHLVTFNRKAWDRVEQCFRPAKDLFREVFCRFDG